MNEAFLDQVRRTSNGQYMNKSIQKYAREWEQNAEADALWIILTDKRYYGNKWDKEEFFVTGEEEISRVFNFMGEHQIEVPKGLFVDFGCGVGRLSRALRTRFSAGMGIDISEKMVDLARMYVPGVDFCVNQQSNLSWLRNESVDFFYSHIVLQHIPNDFQRSYIDEFLRILRPGGLAVIQIPIEIIHKVIQKQSLTIRLKHSIKEAFPYLVYIKRRLSPPVHEFHLEMHALPHDEIVKICRNRGCIIELASATNSCNADNNGKVEFYDLEGHKRKLEQSGKLNQYLSGMYFIRKPERSAKKHLEVIYSQHSNFKWLVCMTTIPERLTSPFLYRVLDSLLSQKTSCDFKIVLFIPHRSLRTGLPYPDPSFLYDRYGKEQIIIHRCDDMGPATKFAGLLTYLPSVDADVTHIYITDDDIILRDHVFGQIMKMLKARDVLQNYRRLVLANDVGLQSKMATVSGYAGILIPLDFFRDITADARLATVWESLAKKQHPCFNVDDMLLSKLFQRFKYNVEGTGLNPFTDVMDRALTDEHPDWFELCKHTSRNCDSMRCLNEILP